MNNLKYIFGLNSDVSDNVLFMKERTIVYTYGNHIVLYHLDQKVQKFIQISEKNVNISAMAISSNKRFLAVAECSKEAGPLINIFDLNILRKRKSLVRVSKRPKSSPSSPVPEGQEKYAQLVFSPDSKYLAGKMGMGEVELWAWERCRLEASLVVCNPQQKPVQVHSLCFSPSDSSVLTATCHGHLKFLKFQTNSLTLTSSLKLSPVHYLCQAWLSEGVLIVASEEGVVVFVEGGEVRNEMRVVLPDEEKAGDKGGSGKDGDNRSNSATQKRMGSSKKSRPTSSAQSKSNEAPHPSSPPPSSSSFSSSSVRHLVATSKGFLCTVGRQDVLQFEGTDPSHCRQAKHFRLPVSEDMAFVSPSQEDAETIQQLVVSSQEEVIVCSSTHNLIYSTTLTLASDLNRVEEGRLLMEGQQNHHGGVRDVSVCLRRPLVVTCAFDGCVKVWNYETNCLELSRHFPEDILTVSIHPTAFFLLVGFSSGVVVMSVLVNELKPLKTIPIKQCNKAVFSHGGHMFAVSNDNEVGVYTSLTFENVHNLKGHLGRVKGFVWSGDDHRLLSCSSAVYLWQVSTERKLAELITRSCDYIDACFSPDEKSFVVIGDDLKVKEVADGQVVRTIDMTVCRELTSLATIGRVLMVASSSGVVSTIKYPLSDTSISHHPTHHCSVIRVAVSWDEQYVASCGSDGGLVVASLHSLHSKHNTLFKGHHNKHHLDTTAVGSDTNNDVINSSETGNSWLIKKELTFLDEVLVNRTDYNEQLFLTRELQQRLDDLVMEEEYKARVQEAGHQQKLQQVTSDLQQQIEELNAKIQSLRTEREKQEKWSDESKRELATKHLKDIQEHEAKSNHKLLLEYEKYQELQAKSQRMQEEYEGRLVEVRRQADEQLHTLTQQDTSKISQLTSKISELETRVVECEREKDEVVRELEEDVDMEVTSVQMRMQASCDALCKENDKLKGQLGMITKKLVSLQRDVDGGREEVGRKEKEAEHLGEVIGNMEREMLNLRKEVKEREATVQEKERRIGELKRSNEELDKYRFVLKQRLSQMEGQVAPQIDQLHCASNQLTEMEQEVEKKGKLVEQMERDMANLRNKLTATEKEVHVQKQKTAKTNTVLERIRTDIHNASALVQDPAGLKEAVKLMHARHVQADVSGAGAAEGSDRAEFSVQRSHLERSMHSMSKELQRGVSSAQADNAKILNENVLLVEEVNKLRQELLLLKSKLSNLQTTSNLKKQTTRKV